MLHRLRDEQLLLNVTRKKITQIDLEADCSLLRKKDICNGPKAQMILQECHKSKSRTATFLDEVKAAYVATGLNLR